MQVQELFARLSYGELSALAIGSEGAGTIAENSHERVVALINAGLTSLYTRFPHRRAFMALTMEAGVHTYVLRPEDNDIVKIVDVTRMDDPLTPDKDETQFMGINQRNDIHGVKVMSHNEIYFEKPVAGERFRVEYQAKHPRLTMPVDLEAEIFIMPALEGALQAHIAAAIFSGMTGAEHTAKSVELNQRYEQLCTMAEVEDMAHEGSADSRDRLRDKGFV